jgi:hypothetical protein
MKLAAEKLRGNIPCWAGWVRSIHTGRNEFDMKDTAHNTGFANFGR